MNRTTLVREQQVLFYQTEGMRYFTQIECRNRRGTKKRGCKVSGFAFKRTSVGSIDAAGTDVGADAAVAAAGGNSRSAGSSPAAGRPSEPGVSPVFGGSVGRGAGGVGGGGAGSHVPEQLLVTTNDSRLRLYNTDDFGMNAKYKGFANDTLQITATFSEDGKQIISGSENGKVCVPAQKRQRVVMCRLGALKIFVFVCRQRSFLVRSSRLSLVGRCALSVCHMLCAQGFLTGETLRRSSAAAAQPYTPP